MLPTRIRSCAFPLCDGRWNAFASVGGLHFWWPKITGRMTGSLGAIRGSRHVVGFDLDLQYRSSCWGYSGMPRRYHAYAPEFQPLNVLSSAGASILAVGYAIPFIYFRGRFGMERMPATIDGALRDGVGNHVASAHFQLLTKRRS